LAPCGPVSPLGWWVDPPHPGVGWSVGQVVRLEAAPGLGVVVLNSFVRHIRQQFIGYIALFTALGGVSYAAVVLPKNSVTSKQIKNGQVKRADLASNAVTSPKVKDGSLLSADFAPGQLVSGAPGPQGPAGPQGATGATGAAGPKGNPGTARAFATVTNAGVVIAARSSNITSAEVTHPATGVYCFDLTGLGIDNTNVGGAVSSPDYNDAATVGGDSTEVNMGTTFGGCAAPKFGVRFNDQTGALKNGGFTLLLP
jgi:hypothetical protein